MPSLRTRPALSLSLATLLCAAACGRVDGHGAPHRPERLAGDWTVEFRLVTPFELQTDTAAVGTVTGNLVLMDNQGQRRVAGLTGSPTHYGVYAADFRRFGMGLRGGARVPTTVAALLPRDSVEIALDPEAGGPYLAGRLAGDSVAGRWWYDGVRSGGAEGRFVMRRKPR